MLTYANSSIDELLKDIFGATIDKKSEGYLKNEAEIKSWIDYHKSKNVPHSIWNFHFVIYISNLYFF